MCCSATFLLLQRHVLPYSPSPYVALALRLYRMVSNEVNPRAFFKLVDQAPYRLALWLYFLFPYVRYLYINRLVSAAGMPTIMLHLLLLNFQIVQAVLCQSRPAVSCGWPNIHIQRLCPWLDDYTHGLKPDHPHLWGPRHYHVDIIAMSALCPCCAAI